MSRLGQEIYRNSWNYRVCAVISKEKCSQRLSVDMYVENPDGEMSGLITITRKEIVKKNSCDFFLNLEGDFTHDDITAIKNKLIELLKNHKSYCDIQSKSTPQELHNAISKYIRDNAEELKDNPKGDYFIKEKYGYMKTSCIDDFVKENKESIGYGKRLEILKLLKIMGVLKNAPTRPYDMLVSMAGEKIHYYKIELADEPEEEKADEVIE